MDRMLIKLILIGNLKLNSPLVRLMMTPNRQIIFHVVATDLHRLESRYWPKSSSVCVNYTVNQVNHQTTENSTSISLAIISLDNELKMPRQIIY
jgi:hypothetical protein